MPLMPKRVKHRKMHRGSRSGNATSGTYVAFGDFGLQVLDRGWITNNQIEACRIAINRYLKRKGKVFIRIFPQKSFTSRPPDTRMGKGKGAVEGWVAVVRPGNILFEVGGGTEAQAREQYGNITVFRSEFRALKHTLSGNPERTLMKLVVDSASDRVVGLHMVGAEAGEIVQGFAVAMQAGATKAVFDATLGIHPTAAEEFVTMREPVRGG